MAFRIKNMAGYRVTALGVNLQKDASVDLSLSFSNAVIRESLLHGELYNKMQGRMLAILSPASDIYSIDLSDIEIARLANAGFLQGYLGTEEVKPPFQFRADGYLVTSAVIESVGGIVHVDGTVSVRGIVSDGSPSDNFPVEIGGVDLNGNIQSLLVNDDGYLMTSTAISIETNSEVEGRVFDGAPVAGIKPIILGGADPGGNLSTLLVDNDGYLLTSTIISVESSSEIEGRVFDGADATGIKPVVISGIDIDGYSQAAFVNSDGYIYTIASFENEPIVQIHGTTADGVAFVDNPVVAGGVYLDDPTASALTDGDAGNILLNNQRMQITEDRVYDAPTDSNKIVPVFIPQDRYEFSDLSGTRADSNATFSYYIDMQGFSQFSLQYVQGVNNGIQTLKFYASNHDVADLTTATYTDVTTDWFGAASFTASAWLERDTVTVCKYIKVEMAITDMVGGDTSTWTLYFMKKVG